MNQSPEINRVVARQRALADLGYKALINSNRNQWLLDVADMVASDLGVENVNLVEAPSTGNLILRAGNGWLFKDGRDMESSACQSAMVKYTLSNGGRFNLHAPRTDERIELYIEPWTMGPANGVGSIVYSEESNPWGVLITHGIDKRNYTDEDVAFVQSAANLAGLVLARNSRETRLAANATEIVELNRRLEVAAAEMRHRVRNNLQIINALVEMQGARTEDGCKSNEMGRLGLLLRSIAAVDDLLPNNDENSGVQGYINAGHLLGSLLPLLQNLDGKLRVSCRVKEILLPVKYCVPLAILVNELFGNAAKFAREEIDVKLHAEENLVHLTVCDDGPGFPKDFNTRTSTGLGLDLVESVVRFNLTGSVTYNNLGKDSGGCVVVTFALPMHVHTSTAT